MPPRPISLRLGVKARRALDTRAQKAGKTASQMAKLGLEEWLGLRGAEGAQPDCIGPVGVDGHPGKSSLGLSAAVEEGAENAESFLDQIPEQPKILFPSPLMLALRAGVATTTAEDWLRQAGGSSRTLEQISGVKLS